MPGGRTQHHANAGLTRSTDSLHSRVPRGGDHAYRVLSMQASLQRGDMSGYLGIGKSRKSGLRVRCSFPRERHNRRIYDPGWTTSNFTGRDWRMVSFCCVRRLLSQILQSFECLLGNVLGKLTSLPSCGGGSRAACSPLDLEGSESKPLF